VLQTTDVGKVVNVGSIAAGGITVNISVFTAGQAVAIFNNTTSNLQITQGSGVTMYLGGTNTTGNRTLSQYGLASVLCVSSTTEFVIVGQGLT